MRSIFKDSPGMGSIPPQELLKDESRNGRAFEVVKGYSPCLRLGVI